jgi:cyclic pyranopterin phosphate synthase
MPAEVYGESYDFLEREQWLDFEEIVRLARLFTRRGVRKIRLTGGEPLLRPNLEELIVELAEIDAVEDLAMTTNGFLLADRADALASTGLGRVTVSLDAIDPERFRALNGVGKDPEAVLRGIDAAAEAGLRPIKINTVVRRGVNEASVLPLVRAFRGTGHVVRFIEYMDVGTRNGWDREEVVPSAELRDRIDEVFGLEPLEAHYPGEVADRYRLTDGSAEIGFVSSITQPFCGTCTRARLSSEGTLYTCLFAQEGTDFRSMLRGGATDDALLDQVIERRQRLVNRRVVVPAVNLIEIDVVGSQPIQRGFGLIKDVLPREPRAVRALVHPVVHLRRDDEFRAVALLDRPTDDLLALAL